MHKKQDDKCYLAPQAQVWMLLSGTVLATSDTGESFDDPTEYGGF